MTRVDVSVVVPVMNDEAGLLFTLDSLNAAARFHQKVVVEVLVVDGNGGSSGQLARARANWPFLHIACVTDPGAGPYAAVDSGLRQANGGVQTWLNAGDYLFPQAFQVLCTVFEKYPQTRWLCGYSSLMTEDGVIGRVDAKPVVYPQRHISAGLYKKAGLGYLQQEGMFWTKDLYLESGGLDLTLKLAADFGLWVKFAGFSELITVASPLAAFEVSPGTQRSRVYETEYLEEVRRSSRSTLFGKFFDAMASVNYVFVVIARFFFFARGNVVVVDVESGRLVLCHGVWPAARVSIWTLISSLRLQRRQVNGDAKS